MNDLLQIRGLCTEFRTEDGLVRAVDGVSWQVNPGRTLGIVGESGCGKSVSALSVMGLIPKPSGEIVGGQVWFKGQDLLKLTERQIREIRGNEIAMIFQEPMTSLNPVFTVGNQIVEAIKLHQKLRTRDAWDLAVESLQRVGVPSAAERVYAYPHQLSGGMRQRVMIAMALSCHPAVLIADEPTTALDVTIQAQILELLRRLQAGERMALVLITHDLAVIAQIAHTVAVMYASRIVEYTSVEALFDQPLHPYTQGLFRSLPRLGQKKRRLDAIGGTVPNPLAFPSGCKFHPRCPLGCDDKRCQSVEPNLRLIRPGHVLACFKAAGYEDSPPCDIPTQAPTEVSNG
ncbi:MAG: ATP-binding cassette domain-containing protein [Actinobacteria bacterium]|nr:ATP-binding cassette domain-containing protein [Actinomycetota bacterium]